MFNNFYIFLFLNFIPQIPKILYKISIFPYLKYIYIIFLIIKNYIDIYPK